MTNFTLHHIENSHARLILKMKNILDYTTVVILFKDINNHEINLQGFDGIFAYREESVFLHLFHGLSGGLLKRYWLMSEVVIVDGWSFLHFLITNIDSLTTTLKNRSLCNVKIIITCSGVRRRLIALVVFDLSSMGTNLVPTTFSLNFDLANWLWTVKTRAIDFLTDPILESLAGAPPVTWATRSYTEK